MALSGTISKTIDGTLKYQIDWSATQSVANNQSTITCRHYLKASNYPLYIGGRSNTCTVDGTSKSYSSSAINGSVSSLLLGTTTHTVNHNADGSKSTTIKGVFNIQATLGGTYFSSVTASSTVALDSIPRAASITTAPNFTDEDNPTITYSNPAGTAVTSLQACIADEYGAIIYAPYRNIDLTGSSYTFNLTNDERAALRNAVLSGSNAKSVKFYVTTVIGGNTFYSTLMKTLTIANAEPTISPSVIDINSKTLELTGDENKLIRYHSNASVSIKPTFKKGATAKDYKIVNGDKILSTATGTFNAVESGVFNFSVTDTRGLTASQTINKTIIDYVHLTCNIEVSRPNALGEMSLKIHGNCFSGSLGTVDNTLALKYYYKEDDGAEVAVPLTIVPSNNTYSIDIPITGLDYRKKYTFRARAVDKLETADGVEIETYSLPVFDWGKDSFNFNVPVTASEGITVKGFELLPKQIDDSGYVGIISAHNDAVSFIRTPQQGLIPYEDGGSGQLGTVGWPFLSVHANAVYSHGAELGVNKILWSQNPMHMNGSQTASLSETVSSQANGIVLVWSAYDGEFVYDYDWHYQFIPKYHAVSQEGTGVTTNMATAGFGRIGAKYVYVYDGYIQGNDKNAASGTNNGITYTNGYWVLRCVIGV